MFDGVKKSVMAWPSTALHYSVPEMLFILAACSEYCKNVTYRKPSNETGEFAQDKSMRNALSLCLAFILLSSSTETSKPSNFICVSLPLANSTIVIKTRTLLVSGARGKKTKGNDLQSISMTPHRFRGRRRNVSTENMSRNPKGEENK